MAVCVLSGDAAIGVELGIKVPAVCVSDDGAVLFAGNGRRNRYIKRRYTSKRKALQKAGKHDAIKKLRNKEQRILRHLVKGCRPERL